MRNRNYRTPLQTYAGQAGLLQGVLGKKERPKIWAIKTKNPAESGILCFGISLI
jgi:hypothetical protein